MSVDDKWKEGNKLLLLVRGDLELLETGKDTSVFLQGMRFVILFIGLFILELIILLQYIGIDFHFIPYFPYLLN
jgi:hypothetical protein